jgi:hypothetical protein
MTKINALLLLACTLPAVSLAFVANPQANRPSATAFSLSSTATDKNPSNSIEPQPQFLDYLKFDGNPSFDVMAKTREYLDNRGKNPETIYSDDYVLRGPVIGPLTRKDLTSTQGQLNIAEAFPDTQTNTFGLTQDPENPYRVFYFEKWRATHTGPLQAGSTTMPPTGNIMDGPVHVNTVCWNPEGKIVYEAVGNVVDRHEGNTEGKAAVFGLLHTAGVKIPGSPGSALLRLIQRLGHLDKSTGRSFSVEEDIPAWWKSKSRGADPTDPSD